MGTRVEHANYLDSENSWPLLLTVSWKMKNKYFLWIRYKQLFIFFKFLKAEIGISILEIYRNVSAKYLKRKENVIVN